MRSSSSMPRLVLAAKMRLVSKARNESMDSTEMSLSRKISRSYCLVPFAEVFARRWPVWGHGGFLLPRRSVIQKQPLRGLVSRVEEAFRARLLLCAEYPVGENAVDRARAKQCNTRGTARAEHGLGLTA